MEAGATTTMTAKLPILNPGEYDLWLMRIESYFLMTDYSLWKVIKNGNKFLKKTVVKSEETYEPTSAEEKLDRRNEMKARGSSNTNQNPQTMAFVSSNITSSTNEADTTANRVSTAHTQCITVNSTSVDNLSDAVVCAFLVSQPNSPQLAKEDLEQIDPDDIEKMDLHWEMAMLTIRARRFMKRACMNLDINGRRIGFDKSKVECFNCHKNGHFARECRALKNQDNRSKEYRRKSVPVETPIENALIAQDGIRGSASSSESEVDSCCKSCMKAYANLKEEYDSLTLDYKKS
nr:hypothetical protein [Tanacetum cinerariifolium]